MSRTKQMRNSAQAGKNRRGIRKCLGLFLLLPTAYCLLSVFSGCTSAGTVVKKNYDFSNIKKIAVLRFTGDGGDAVSNEFMKQFLASSVDVVDRTDVEKLSDSDIKTLGVDAVVSGNVTEFNPSNKFLVFEEKGNVVISNKAYRISGTTVLQSAPVLGMENANVYSVSASVSVSARIADTSLGEIVWSDSKSYEALDINTAIGSVVSSFRKSLKLNWKELQ